MLASGGNKIVFHDTISYGTVYEYGPYLHPVRHLDWSSDSKYLLVVPGSDYTEIIRPYATQAKVLQNIKVKDVSAAAFFKKSHRYIGVGCNNGQVFVWDTKKQVMDKKMLPALSNVNCVNISSTDNYLSAGCENGSILLYGVKTNQKLHSLDIKQSKRPITSLEFSTKDQGMLGATNDEGYVAVWDIMKPKSCFAAKKHSAICSGVAFSPINTYFFVSVGYDRLICMCDLRASQAICMRETKYALTSVNMTPDGIMMACGHRNGGVLIYDLRNNTEPLLELTAHIGIVSSVAYYKDIKTLNTTQRSRENSIENNISSDAEKTERNQSVSSDQLNNSFLRLYDSPSTTNVPQISAVNDGKRDSFLDDLDSPSPIPHIKFGLNEVVQNNNDTMCLISQFTESREIKDLMLAPQNHSRQSTPGKGDEDDIPSQNLSIIDESKMLEIDATEIVTRSDLERLKKELKAEIDESLKKHTMHITKILNSNMLQLHMFLSKQQVDLMDKLDSRNIDNDVYDLDAEMKRLYDRNAELNDEITWLKTEREKYLSSIAPNEGI